MIKVSERESLLSYTYSRWEKLSCASIVLMRLRLPVANNLLSVVEKRHQLIVACSGYTSASWNRLGQTPIDLAAQAFCFIKMHCTVGLPFWRMLINGRVSQPPFIFSLTMKMSVKTLFVAAAVAFAATSCTQTGKENAEAAADNTEAAAENAGDAVSAEANNAANATENAVDKAAANTEAAAENAGTAIDNAGEKAGQKIEAGAEKAANATEAAANKADAKIDKAAAEAKAEVNKAAREE